MKKGPRTSRSTPLFHVEHEKLKILDRAYTLYVRHSRYTVKAQRALQFDQEEANSEEGASEKSSEEEIVEENFEEEMQDNMAEELLRIILIPLLLAVEAVLFGPL
ncbi:hypothetical protein PIB30_095998 [Stylosanthes scabra]|uniref:Uncharacterized protein n=1 Tax=Stylosanthes scabra TaxID=79078 RepID=A0ABU6ZUK3_9FABA|nr:hypothetical protein [Stylosanthes scabra]